MRSWTQREYVRLFRDWLPTQPHAPSREEATAIGVELDRTHGAISAQWNDARNAILENKTAASQALKDFLANRGWL